MTKSLRDHVLIAAVAGIVLFWNLGASRLWDRDEPRNAGCAVEMLQGGDWIVPVFNAELRTHKPVLLYWLMMSAYAVFGVNEFAARFWSAALSIGTVLLTYRVGRRLFDASAGRWAAVVLATALMFDVASRAATPDAALVFFSTLGLAWFVLGSFPKRSTVPRREPMAAHESVRGYFPQSKGMVLLMYGAFGFAVLAKGPVGFLLPMAVIGMFLLIVRLPAPGGRGNRHPQSRIQRGAALLRPFAPRHFLQTLWSMRPITAAAAVLAVAAPWYTWVGIRTGGVWLEGFFLQHNIGRAMAAMEGHQGGLWYYPIAMLAGFFPWSILAVPVVVVVTQGIRRSHCWKDGYIFCACWVGVYVGLFSLAQTKLPNYVTPAYPALALLTGCFLRQWVAVGPVAWPAWLRIGWTILSIVGVVVAAGIALATTYLLPGEQWLAVIGLIPVVGGIAAWVFTECGQRRAAAVSLAVTAGLFSVGLFGIAAPRADRHQRNHELLQAIASASEAPHVAAFGRLEPSWVFYAGRPIRFIPRHRPNEAIAFLGEDQDRFLITTDAELPRLLPQMAPHVDVLRRVPYFLRDSELVAIGTTTARVARMVRPVVVNGRAGVDGSSPLRAETPGMTNDQ